MKKRRIVKLLVVLCLVLALIPVTAFAAETGWVDNADGTKSYVQENGELVKNCVIEIDDKWYSFDYNGIMLTDKEFYDGNYYQSKADGTLYENEWYQPYPSHEPNRWYYYGADRKRVRNAVVNIMNADTGKEEAWSFDSIGYATKLEEGWFQSNINIGTFFYVKDGALLQNTIAEIEGKYYAFSIDGKNYRNQEINYVDENDSSLNGYYRAKADGSLYVNEWFEASTYYRYYYGEGGKAQTGLMVASDTAYYYFKNDGRLTCGEDVSILNSETGVEEPWLFGADGLGMKLAEGWNEFLNGKQVYVDNGKVCEGTIRTIDGVRYLFGWDFHLLEKGQIISIFDPEYNLNGCYRAKEGGVAYINEWYTECDENGKETKYYYGEYGCATYGPKTVDGTLYFFWASGQMATDCIMDDSAVVDGVIITTYYYCDESGKATLLENNQWLELSNGRLKYYTQDGQTLKKGVHTIDGVNYLFDENGYLAQENQVVAIEINNWLWDYRAKADGTVYENEWYTEVDDENKTIRYYYGEGGMPASGSLVIDGIRYCFTTRSGIMKTDYFGSSFENGNLISYYYDSNGVGSLVANIGWNLLPNGKWVYIENRGPKTSGRYQINGSWYAFDGTGYMYDNTEYYDGNYYRAKPGGALYVNEWYAGSDEEGNVVWYYYGDPGVAARGFKEIDGVTYYFGEKGQMLTNYFCSKRNGRVYDYYYFGSDGVGVIVTNNAWNLLSNGKWIYVKDGALHTGWLDLDGTKYYMDENGIMQTDWLLLDDTWYYLNAGGAMQTGRVTIDGKLHDFSDSGAWLGEVTVQTGWVQENGCWYYYDANGNLTTGWLNLNGTWYYMDANGVMQTGWLNLNGTWYYLNEGGDMATGWLQLGSTWYYLHEGGNMATGWLQLGSTWYYLNEGGDMATGWLLLGNTWYYLNEGGAMVTGEQCLGGNWYAFDSSGAWIQ